jgi:hypothetical protein
MGFFSKTNALLPGNKSKKAVKIRAQKAYAEGATPRQVMAIVREAAKKDQPDILDEIYGS